MNLRLAVLLLSGALTLSGCISRTPVPQTRLVEGIAVAADTGLPLSRAWIWIHSDDGRTPRWWEIFPRAAGRLWQADENGYFSSEVLVYDYATIRITKGAYSGRFQLQDFLPEGGGLVVVRVHKEEAHPVDKADARKPELNR